MQPLKNISVNLPTYCLCDSVIFSERLQEEKEIAEEVLEKRMEILTKSVKKTHSKRPRIQEDPEEYVPAMVHTALEAKMEVRGIVQIQLLKMIVHVRHKRRPCILSNTVLFHNRLLQF